MRKVSHLILSAALVFSFSACSQNLATNPSEGQPTATELTPTTQGNPSSNETTQSTETIENTQEDAFLDEEPIVFENHSSYQPTSHGYRFVDVLNWTPESDAYSNELRARVPLQERNAVFAATQANPNLRSDAQVLNTAMGNYRATDTLDGPWCGAQYYDDFSYNLFQFWQYTDFVGSGGRPTPGFDAETVAAYNTNEYGILGIPIAAYTNTAHKNGVKMLAEYYIPRDPQYTEEWLYQAEDGSFPYAQKLIDIMNYYGFDGYFINQEKSFDATLIPRFKQMLSWMVSQGCYIQWYDAIAPTGTVSYENEFNESNREWVLDDNIGQVSNSIWLNYWWDKGRIDNSVALAESLGLDPYETLFLGIECGMGGFTGSGTYYTGQSTSEGTVGNLDWILDETGNPKMSLSLWGGAFVHEAFNSPENLRYTSGYQWMSEERQRLWYSSPTESVLDYDISSLDLSELEAKGKVTWSGLSKYVAERSVIHGTNFYTHFNTGHGMQYFVDGEVSRNVEWSNINLQDFLPTWQWWVETDNMPLSLDWDYGKKLTKVFHDGTTGSFDFQSIGAYEGGSSLVIYGDLAKDDQQRIHLYKTDLQVTDTTQFSLTYQKVSDEDTSMLSLGLIFKDTPEEWTLLEVADSNCKSNGWTNVTFDLSDYAGKEIASIGVQITAKQTTLDYQINLGEMKLSEGNSVIPETPENFAISKVFDGCDEVELTWTIQPYEKIAMYHIYATYENGSKRFVSGAYTDNLFLSVLEFADSLTGFELYALDSNGTYSEPAFVALDKHANVTDISAVSENNQLAVSWKEPDTDFEQVEVKLDYFYDSYANRFSETILVEKGANHVCFDNICENGSRYLLTLTTIGETSSSVTYFGTFCDTYSEPYDGSIRINAETNTFSITLPDADDWYRLHISYNDVTKNYSRHKGNPPYGIPLEDGIDTISITVDDQDGNVSEPVVFQYQNGEFIRLYTLLAY